ncbi:MAG: hypothetical protein FJW90_08795 [Actinobacteria bacterium]|nr:hypothetical protein [Actinomycetota bacterium]
MDLRDLGAAGALLVLWQALVHAVIWYPAEILDAAAGFVYGFGPALPLLMASWKSRITWSLPATRPPYLARAEVATAPPAQGPAGPPALSFAPSGRGAAW